MATVEKTPPTFTSVETIGIFANGTMGTVRTLNLKNKLGASLLVWIGRQANTTPTRGGYVQIRNSLDTTAVFPNRRYDVEMQGPTTAANATTLTATSAAGTNTVAVTSNTGFSVGDTVCFSESGGNRLQFNRIVSIGGASNLTFTLERNLTVDANSGDTISNLADARAVFLPPGDIYEIRVTNYSGLGLVVRVAAIVDNGETIT